MVRCSPTEFTEFTEFGSVGMAGMPYPPTSVNIRVIRGSPFFAIGSVSSVRSVGISFLPRISQIYTDTYGALFSHRIHRIHRIWQRGYGRDAIPSYICAHPCHPWEALLCQKFLCVPCVLWELLHRLFGWCSGDSCTPGLAAWVWQGCHTLLICAHPCHQWESFLCQRFCVFGAFRGSFFTACSVGAAETAAPPGGIHRSSVHISPPHHLTTTTPFHLEPCLLHVLPVLWVRLRHHLRLVDAQPGEHDCRRCERHRHAVVVVGVDRL